MVTSVLASKLTRTTLDHNLDLCSASMEGYSAGKVLSKKL
jgi:hypothetical protein